MITHSAGPVYRNVLLSITAVPKIHYSIVSVEIKRETERTTCLLEYVSTSFLYLKTAMFCVLYFAIYVCYIFFPILLYKTQI